MSYDLILRDVEIASGNGLTHGDIAVKGGKIERIGDLGSAVAGEERIARGLTAIPGLIDTQVHFREPGLTHKEDLESGTRAAICGGVTTIFEMPNTNPATTDEARLQEKLDLALGRAWCDYSFFVGASRENLGRLRDYEQLPGTPGIKIFVGSSTGSLLVEDDELLGQVLSNGVRPCSIHSEDEPRLRERLKLALPSTEASSHPYLRDAEAAANSTRRVLKLAGEAGRHVHILHISTGDEIPLLRQAKAEGQNVTCEVTPQHLYFAAPEAYDNLGSLVQMNPPIRETYHRDALWAALTDDVFDVFGSDHAPHTLDEKALPYLGHPKGSPSGMPGVQTMLQALLRYVQQGRLSLNKLVRMASERPAELFGIRDKGFIAEGMDADIVLVDPTATCLFGRPDVQSKCGWSPFEGHTLAAPPVAVYLRGGLCSAAGKPAGASIGVPVRFNWKD